MHTQTSISSVLNCVPVKSDMSLDYLNLNTNS